jgi:hypothetical protein
MSAPTAVCILIHGRPEYFCSGREAALSVLEHSDFDLRLLVGRGTPIRIPKTKRVQTVFMDELPTDHHRSERFLLKFLSLRRCLQEGSHEFIIQLDADALFATRLETRHLIEALGEYPMGMVEQTTIKGSTMGRADFLDHYRRHSLALIDPQAPAPPLDRFRYFNSGFVLARTTEMARLVDWALARMGEFQASGQSHQIGNHMIADQDYFQFYVHQRHPGCCAALPWHWNHCDLWDDDFPRPDARVVHFSNFCQGPDRRVLERLTAFRRRGKGLLPRVASLGDWLRRLFP